MSNEIGDDYYHTMDRDYKQKVYQSRAGPHVFEDVEGKFTTSLPKWIRTGTESIELQLGQGRAGEMGPESYGKEAREELKKLAELTGVNVHTVHAPVSVMGMSGFDSRNGQFAEGRSDLLVNELNKTIDFAADTTKGSNIVFHLGEFPRSISEADSKFASFEGEEKEAQVYFGDKITGSMFRPISRNGKIQSIERNEDGTPQYDENGRKVVKEHSWNDFKEDYDDLQNKYGGKKAKDVFIKKHNINENLIEKWKEDLPMLGVLSENFQAQLEDLNSQETRWQLEYERAKDRVEHAKKLGDKKEEELYKKEMESRNDLMAEIDRKKLSINRMRDNLVPLKDLALPRSADAIAKAAINAYDRVQEKHLSRPITLVPENLGPNEYGSHPDEMIEIVNKSRGAFVKRLTQKEIEDPRGISNEDGSPKLIDNPYYRKDLAENPEKVKQLAKDYIKSTIDAQHLQMWQSHFKREQGETELQREKRFYKWYDEKLRKLMKEDVIGHVHVVDGMGRGHVHLPVGQGRIMEMSEAFDELRSMGLSMTHEGWMEGQERHLSGTWGVAGPKDSPGQTIYGSSGGDYVLGSRYHRHLGANQAPNYFVPDEVDFSSHPEDFRMWSEVPLE